MNTKFSLTPAPTWKKKVAIPRPGDSPLDIEFEFIHRTVRDFDEFIAKGHLDTAGKPVSDADYARLCAVGWELDDEFTAENVGAFIENFPGAATAIAKTYVAEYVRCRTG